MKRIALWFVAGLALAACSKDYYAYPADELGATKKSFEVSAEAGGISVHFYANSAGTAFTDASWLHVENPSFNGDGTLSVRYDTNDGIPRHSHLLLETPTRRDTVTIYQKGAVDELFEFSSRQMLVYNRDAGQDIVVPATVTVPIEKVSILSVFPGYEWVSDIVLTATGLHFKTEENMDSGTRRGSIFLSFVDGWGNTQEHRLTIIQAPHDDIIGTPVSAEQLRAAATPEGYDIPEGSYFEGYIVSTSEFGNAGDSPVEDWSGNGVIDYERNDRTVYIESLDGKYGFKMLTANEADNVFVRDQKVGLLLYGAAVFRTASAPVCYTIEGVTSSMLLYSSEASNEMPAKRMSIADLKDDDIYTGVTLLDCEIPMRKGPFTPINEGYGTLCSYNFISKFPMLLRDKQGGSLQMWTNMKCSWRRDGKPMPAGSGDVRGVIVSEQWPGDIGRYQIRPMTREDIALSESFDDNFSGLVSEFRYVTNTNPEYLAGAIVATQGNGELTHTYTGYTYRGKRMYNFSPSYFYLGPCGSKRKGEYVNGVGIFLEDGSEYIPWAIGDEGKQNTDGKGWIATECRLSWSNKYWWDSGNNRGYSWLFRCSTAGITSDRASVQFAMYNNSQKMGSPRYWKISYSTTSQDPTETDQWTEIGQFTVNDVMIWANRYDWCVLGTQVYDFPLPASVLGQDMLCIALTPRNNKAGKITPTGYDSGTIANNSGYNTMDYFAIRYNK